MMFARVTTVCLVLALAAVSASSRPSSRRFDLHRGARAPKQHHARSLSKLRSTATTPSLSPCPADFGGDPTGVKDSTAAVSQALQTCFNATAYHPERTFPYYEGDAGGCTVDLQGGEYLISSSLQIPAFIANLRIGYGSLVASATFPANDFMITVGTPGLCKTAQGSCSVDIGFPGLFMDGARTAGGVLQVNSVMGTTIGPHSYFLNFTQYGVQVNGGHEVMISNTWMGETNFDHEFSGGSDVPTSIAIQINSNDHYIEDSIVFSSRIGLEMNGAANMVSGLHVWFPFNQAKKFGATAFQINGSQNRFDGCYVDGSTMVISPKAVTTVWTNGFFLGSNLIFQSVGAYEGIQLTQNEFQGGSDVVQLPSGSTFTNVNIKDNIFHGPPLQSTEAVVTQQFNAADSAVLSFCSNAPLVGNVTAVTSIAVTAAGPPVSVNAMPSSDGCTVPLIASRNFTGSAVVTVTSSH